MSDYSRVVDLSQVSDPGLEKAFTFLCRHLVSLTGAYQEIIDGKPAGKEGFFTVSGFLLSIRGVWCFATAGHVLKKIEKPLVGGKVKLNRCFLLDDFGPEPVSHERIPFDYENAPKCYFVDDAAGLDFGLIALNLHYRRLLEINNALAVTEENGAQQHTIDFDQYFMVGLPSKFLSTEEDNEALIQKMAPAVIPAHKVDISSVEVRQTTYPRLVARIGESCPYELLDGMSGGPILGFSNDKPGYYWVVAIQSSISKAQRLTFGCRIPIVASLVEELLNEAGDAEDANAEGNV